MNVAQWRVTDVQGEVDRPCAKYINYSDWTEFDLREVQNQLQPPYFVHNKFEEIIFYSVKHR